MDFILRVTGRPSLDAGADRLFLFYQVNSDKIYWQRNLDGTFSQILSEKKAVGHNISTKAVGSEERADITHLYKHQEGTGGHLD